MSKSRLEKLIEVGNDLNTTMKLEPPIPVDVESAKELKQLIKDEMALEGGQLYETDKQTLKDETWEYLTETLGISPRKATPAASTTHKPKKSEKKKEEQKVAKAAVKKKAAKKAAKKAVKKKAAPAAAKKGPGVIASIREIVLSAKTKAKAMSKDDILKKMIKAFPDREEKSLKNTINVQVPSRITKETDYDVIKTDAGLYWVRKKK